MATPRKRWFRVPNEIAWEPWSNDQLAMLVRLQGLLGDRWAREGIEAKDAGRISLRAADLMAVSGKRRRDAALELAVSLTSLVSMKVTCRCGRAGGSSRYRADIEPISTRHRADLRPTSDRCRCDVIVIEWPKWPTFQGLPSRDPGNGCPEIALSAPAPSHSPSEEKRKRRVGTRETPSDAPSKPAPEEPSASGRPDTQKRQGKEKSKPPSWAVSIAERLHAAAAKKWPGTQKPRSFSTWARDIARIQASPEQIEDVCRFIFSDQNSGQYEFVVQSGRSLRDKFDRIAAQAARSKSSAAPKSASDEGTKMCVCGHRRHRHDRMALGCTECPPSGEGVCERYRPSPA